MTTSGIDGGRYDDWKGKSPEDAHRRWEKLDEDEKQAEDQADGD